MLGDAIVDEINSAVGGVVDTIMKGIWAASVWLLRTVFQLVDSFTVVNFVSVDGGVDPASPIATIWPLMRWLSLAIALGLFFLQLTMTMLRGGRGLFRLATGPLAYAVAVSMTAGGIGLLFAAGDGLSAMLLEQGLRADGFVGVLDSEAAAQLFVPAPNLDAPTGPLDPLSPQARAESAASAVSQIDATARAIVLGLVALFAVIPAGIGFLLENIFRLAVFLVLVGTSPITAAGLVADATAAWFWRGLRWAVAAALLKPALALVLVIGVNMLSRPTGLAGLLAGAGVLLVALFCPFAVYRLLAFVDPGTSAGMTARGALSGGGAGRGGAGSSGDVDPSGGGEDGGEAAHAARFDAAGAGSGTGGSGAGAAGGGGSGAAGGRAGAGGGGAAAGAGGVIAGVGAAVAAAGAAASQYANRTMDASGIGYPHGGGRGGAPHAARGDHGGGVHDAGGSPGGGVGAGGPDDDPRISSSGMAWPDYGDHDPAEPPYDDPGGYDPGGYDPGGYDPGGDDPGPGYGDPGSGYGDGGYGYAAHDPAVQPAHAPGPDGAPAAGGAAAPPPSGT
jgi:hypothetical protein